MPDYAIELDFVGLSPEGALSVTQFVAGNGRIEWAEAGEHELSWDKLRAQFLDDQLYESFVRVRCRDVLLDGIAISVMLMLIGEEEGGCFVELSFNSSSVDRRYWGSLVKVLHAFASDVQRQIGVPEFYAGVQSAEDVDLRLFTDSKFGPVRFDETGVHFPR